MNHKRQYVLYGLAAFVAIGLIGLGLWHLRESMSDTGELNVLQTASTTTASSTPIAFEIVKSEKDLQKGLSGRRVIPSDYGMLFVFKEDDRHGIWMKDMLTRIDIIWLSDTGRIVHFEESVDPATYPTVFYPSVPARYVLEMQEGQVVQRGWKLGTQVNLPLPYGKSVSE